MIRETKLSEGLEFGIGVVVVCACGRKIDHLERGSDGFRMWGNGDLYATAASQTCWECKERRRARKRGKGDADDGA